VQDTALYKRVQAIIAQGKDNFLSRSPDIDQLVDYWYGRLPRSVEAAVAVSNRMGVKVPVASR
jgi:hypothetical protein